MNVIKEWQRRLEALEKSIGQHEEILQKEELTQDMRYYLLNEIKNKKEYRNLIRQTISLLKTLE